MRFHNSPPVAKSKKLSTKLFGLCSDESIISHRMILNRYSLFCVYPYPAELALFVISPDCRGKGVGKQLYQQFLQYLKKEHLDSFYLYTDTSCNYGFYEHQGMVRRCEKEHIFTVNQKRSKMTFFIYDCEI